MSILARSLSPAHTASSAWLRTGAQVVGGSLLMAVCAHVSLPLFFTPVPLTLQTLGVLLIGLSLAPGAAFGALALYLLEGAAGLPVLSPHGIGGIAQLFGPTGGYLLSYPFVAAAMAVLCQRLTARRSVSAFAINTIAAVAGTVLFLTAGTLFLAAHLHSLRAGWMMGALPFLPGEAIKIAAAAALCSSTSLRERLAR